MSSRSTSQERRKPPAVSKIALGQRLPTEAQAAALAAFFAVPVEEVHAKRIADKFWNEHKNSPGAHKAIRLIKANADARNRCHHG